ncbi:MAG: diguanylate cyclase [Deltaproteobacteria bacterium]|nr:diguanylate cyclase [Deltaproteobacteria bacterium]
MLPDIFKRQVGLKIALFTALLLIFVSLVFMIVVNQFQPHILDNRSATSFLTLFSVFFIFLQTALVVIAVNLYISRPLQKLMRSMQKVEEGGLSELCDIETEDEFGVVGQNFNKMITSLNQINSHRKHIEQRLIKAEESLKYKIELEEKAKIIERMNRELTSAFNDITLLYMVSQYLSSILDIDELVSNVQRIFTEKFICDAFALYFVLPKQNRVRLAAQKGLYDEAAPSLQGYEFELAEGIAREILKRKRCLYIENLADNTAIRLSKQEEGLKGSVFALPLTVRDDVIGILTVCRYERSGFSPTDRQSLDSIATQVAIAFDRSKLYTKTRELSVRDELTGAFNRRHFDQVLKQELKRVERFNREVSLLMIDVDHFKDFNDKFGHLKGDELLKRLTVLLQSSIREVDLLARFGGEEFVVILTNTELKDAVNVANKLRKIIKSQLKNQFGDIEKEEWNRDITISIGVSSYPECALTAKDLIHTADMAMYHAKRDGRDLVRKYQLTDLLPFEEMIA